jgi:hypothetical protein
MNPAHDHDEGTHGDEPPPVTLPPPPLGSGIFAWMIGPIFLALAAYFLLVSPPMVIPPSGVETVARERFAPGGVRRPMQDPPTAVSGGYEHACNECHRTFDSPPVERRTLVQHTQIYFDHGMNNRCFNCHDRANRERLVLHDGTLLTFSEVPRLCSQCHGTVYRDWQRGTHGKTMGSWDAASGDQHRLVCNDCHNPHAPAYRPLVPLPGPVTLRMGNQVHEAAHAERHIPLRRWSLPEEAHEPAPSHDANGAEHPEHAKEPGR